MENVKTLFSEMVKKLIEKGITITCMESMTGGFIASCITDVQGASGVFAGSYVCYSNEEKIRLGVPKEIIDSFSVYSSETAKAMAFAAQRAFRSDIAVGVTGNAGNTDPANPMGTPGVVYGAIVFDDSVRGFTLEMTPSLTRGEMKSIVAQKVAEEILALL